MTLVPSSSFNNVRCQSEMSMHVVKFAAETKSRSPDAQLRSAKTNSTSFSFLYLIDSVDARHETEVLIIGRTIGSLI
jgi:hypothetical protein